MPDEFGLQKGQAEFEGRAARQHRFREQEVAAAGPLGDPEVFGVDTQFLERLGDGRRSGGFACGRKPRLLAIRRIDHVPTEHHDLSGSATVRVLRHRC